MTTTESSLHEQGEAVALANWLDEYLEGRSVEDVEVLLATLSAWAAYAESLSPGDSRRAMSALLTQTTSAQVSHGSETLH